MVVCQRKGFCYKYSDILVRVALVAVVEALTVIQIFWTTELHRRPRSTISVNYTTDHIVSVLPRDFVVSSSACSVADKHSNTSPK